MAVNPNTLQTLYEYGATYRFDIRSWGYQVAFDMAQEYGGEVFIPPVPASFTTGYQIPINNGAWIVSSSIIVKSSNFTVSGVGGGSILRAANNLNAYVIVFNQASSNGITGVTFRNFTIDGNNTNQSAGGCMDANGSYRNHFDSINFLNPYESGLQLRFGPGGGFGFQNQLRYCQFLGGYTSAGVGRGLWSNNCDENNFIGLFFQDNGGQTQNDNVHVRDENGLNSYYSCIFVGNGHGGPNSGGSSTGGDGAGIKMYSTNGSRIIGCVFDGVRGGNVVLSGSNNNIISGNRFLNIGFNAKASNIVDGVYNSGNSNIITDNYFNPAGDAANGCKAQVELDGNNGEANCMLTGNIFAHFTTGGSQILTDGTPTGNVTSPNILL